MDPCGHFADERLAPAYHLRGVLGLPHVAVREVVVGLVTFLYELGQQLRGLLREVRLQHGQLPEARQDSPVRPGISALRERDDRLRRVERREVGKRHRGAIVSDPEAILSGPERVIGVLQPAPRFVERGHRTCMASSRMLRKNMVSQVSSCSGLADLSCIGQGHNWKSRISSSRASRNDVS